MHLDLCSHSLEKSLSPSYPAPHALFLTHSLAHPHAFRRAYSYSALNRTWIPSLFLLSTTRCSGVSCSRFCVSALALSQMKSKCSLRLYALPVGCITCGSGPCMLCCSTCATNFRTGEVRISSCASKFFRIRRNLDCNTVSNPGPVRRRDET